MKAAPHRAASDTTKLVLAGLRKQTRGRSARRAAEAKRNRKQLSSNLSRATLSQGAARNPEDTRPKMAAHHVSNVVT